MRNSSWIRWFNSFGFITVVIFSFAFLTTMDFSTGDHKGPPRMPSVLAQSGIGQTLDQFGTLAAERYGEAGAPFYIVQGSASQTYAYRAW
jgi:hypothetical protein